MDSSSPEPTSIEDLLKQDYVTIQQISRSQKVDYRTARKWVSKMDDVYKFGKEVRVPTASFRKFLIHNTTRRI